ncbi:MAG: Phosphate transport system permease protein PstC [Planctomycetes bacterium ADurb.Bin412]|nr:MAG: Phosphate transport system permease protein PstC [Planctomycetes bacterium ADurb.Bin412]
MQNLRVIKEKWVGRLMGGLTVFTGLMVLAVALGLYLKARPVLAMKSWGELLFSRAWYPFKGEFGFYPFIMGSLWVTALALLIAIPLCLLAAIYLSEYASKYVRELARPLIDLLAGIPSVVYGVWGVLFIVPLVRNTIAPLLGTTSTGYTTLAGGIVLAIMVFPILIHITWEVLGTVPQEIKEASLALGATPWQTIKYVVVRKSLPGILAAVVLAFSRAFGETMAVLMVAGNVAKAPASVLDPCYPLPALIANNYGEMLSIPLYDSAILLASLILLLVVLLFNILARIVLVRMERRVQ